MSDQQPAPETGFRQFALSPELFKAINDVGYEVPSAIQEQAIQPLLEGRDVLGQAQTGTGKTAAFALPLLSRLNLKQSSPGLLVLTPTRELAIQVAEAFQVYARYMKGFQVLPVYGGQHIGEQLRALRRGVNVVVGTPGRVIDHLKRKTLDLSSLEAVVLDEADEMLNMGFLEDVTSILENTPDKKQVALFSATLPRDIKRISERFLVDPVHIQIKTKSSTVDSVRQRYIKVKTGRKLEVLTRVLEGEQFDAVIIFSRTKTGTMELSEKLMARGYNCGALNGDMNQAMREKTIDQLRRGSLDVVVATDVAARGLDISRISHVINYDIPHDTEAYVHRIGRTGRAGRKGEAILLIVPRELHLLKFIERHIRQTIEQMQVPTQAELLTRRVEEFKAKVISATADQELSYFTALVESMIKPGELDYPELAAALALLAQQDRPLVSNGEPDNLSIDESNTRDDHRREGRGEGRRSRDREGGRDRDSGGREASRRDKPGRRDKQPEPGMRRYHVGVGRDHGVMPGNLVGAIANEAQLRSRQIGQIHIHQQFSTVDLPEDLSKAQAEQLKTTVVCNRPLALREWRDGGDDQSSRGDKSSARFGKDDGNSPPRIRNDRSKRRQSADSTAYDEKRKPNDEKPPARTKSKADAAPDDTKLRLKTKAKPKDKSKVKRKRPK
jgi:ATP-dependent RNA helicase DeaD